MSTQQLILHPTDHRAGLDDLNLLINGLHEVGFLGEEFDLYGQTYYRMGKNFFDFITLRSSHTVVCLERTDDGLKQAGRVDSRDLCRISIEPVKDTAWFLGSAITESPLCPFCQHEIQDWGDMLGDWYEDKANYRWQCPQCGRTFTPYEMDWKNRAGFARYSVDIERIYVGEAYPTTELLNILGDITGHEWTYCYSWF